MFENARNAFTSIWSNKIRSILTVLGVVIGVASVTTLIGLGEGLKRDVSGLIQGLGTNVVVVIGGKIDTTNPTAQTAGSTNPANFITGDILTLNDVSSVQSVPGVENVSPISLVSGTVKNGAKAAHPTMFGTYPTILDSLQVLNLESGSMFMSQSAGHVIVLGQSAKNDLFGTNDAIGQTVTIGQDDFTVIGVLGKAKSSSIFGSEFDAVSIIPFDTATELNKNEVKIMRIVSKAQDASMVNDIKNQIQQVILNNHNQEEDFTVLTQDTILGLFDKFLNLATTMVSAIAAISLIVGGIGIMNIMLVTVTERTREIGLRKAVGATKGAILFQFLVEAIIITFVGSLIGLLIAFIAVAVVAAKTELKPAITLHVVLIATGIAVAIGIIFGLWPAIQAANKDPIDALRYE